MIIGVDVGWTLMGVRPENNNRKISPNSFETIKQWVERGDTVYLISKANSSQKEEVENWLNETNFFDITGVSKDNLYFCHERRDKQFFVIGLHIEVMIDDRCEVMANLSPLVIKFLLNPDVVEFDKYKNLLFNTKQVSDWYQIESALR